MKSVLSDVFSRSSLISSFPVIIALMLSGVISFSYNRLLKEYRDDVDHTMQVMGTIDNVLLQLQDAETGQRGYIITGDEGYLAPFQNGRNRLVEVFSRLNDLVSDNAAQLSRMETLRSLAGEKLQELQKTIGIRKQEGLEPARREVIGSVGKETMDNIRAIAADMRETETKLFEARLAHERFAEQIMVLVAVVCVALSLAGRFVASLLKSRVEAADGERK